jgi:hypothetical protein
MTWDHDRVEELIAARALDGLDAEEAALAERALIEHVPGCPRCREALDAYRLVAGDLALLADPVPTPETLDARVRRTVLRRRRRRFRGAGWTAAAVAAVVALALAGWNVALTARLSQTEVVQGWLVDAVQTSGHPNNEVVPLAGPGSERASMVYVHGEQRMYVMASSLPEAEGVYRVWLLGDDKTWSPGILEPHHGVAFLFVRTDPEQWEIVMVTDEPDEEAPSPTTSPLVSATVE